MSDPFFGYGGMGAHRRLLEQTRLDLIQLDNDGWWLREWAMAEWCKNTLFPQAIDNELGCIFASARAMGGGCGDE